MMGLGWQELVIVLIIIMVIFGAGKLPEVAKSLGQGVKEFKQEATAPVDTATLPATERLESPARETAATAPEPVHGTVESARAEAPRAAETAREAI
jgi:sec-independent protein translocase protein TatA